MQALKLATGYEHISYTYFFWNIVSELNSQQLDKSKCGKMNTIRA